MIIIYTSTLFFVFCMTSVVMHYRTAAAKEATSLASKLVDREITKAIDDAVKESLSAALHEHFDNHGEGVYR